MLTTLLENQVKGGKWHALIDKVYDPLNLYTAARKVTGKRKAGGVDGQSCEDFEAHLLAETQQLSEELQAHTYRPSAVRRVHIPKPGRPNETRPLGIPTVTENCTHAQRGIGIGHDYSPVSSVTRARLPDSESAPRCWL
jgi:retron-type reverse transcriptase